MPPSPLASSIKAPDLPTPPRPSRGVKRRLPPDLTPLVERTLSFKSSANGSSRDSRRGSASTNGITSSGGQSAAVRVSVSPDKSNRKRASRIVSNDGNGRALPSQEPETAMEESQKRTADLFSGWREEYFEIVEQLPLEMHRSYSLIRELEGQVRAHIETIRRETLAYRDYRIARHERQMAATELTASTSSSGMGKGAGPSELHVRSANSTDLTSSGDALTSDDSSLSSSGTTKASTVAAHSHSTVSTPPPIRPLAAPSGAQKDSTGNVDAQEQPTAPTTLPTAPYKRHLSLAHVSRACSSAVAASEEKVGLALAVYQLIDRQCRRLDADLAKAAGSAAGTGEGPMELEEGVRMGTMESRKSQKLGGGAVAGSGEQDGAAAEVTSRSSRSAAQSRSGKASSDASAKNSRGADQNSAGSGLADSAAAGPESLLVNGRDDGIPNMAVDPNEPVYCYCRGPSHGLMVGCDNDECPYEWFHLSCLGMTEPPADNRQWFCQDCSQAKSGGGIAGRADVAPSAIKAGRKSGGRKSQGATVGTNGKKR